MTLEDMINEFIKYEGMTREQAIKEAMDYIESEGVNLI